MYHPITHKIQNKLLRRKKTNIYVPQFLPNPISELPHLLPLNGTYDYKNRHTAGLHAYNKEMKQIRKKERVTPRKIHLLFLNI